jgi:hypothetical protein
MQSKHIQKWGGGSDKEKINIGIVPKGKIKFLEKENQLGFQHF